MAQKVLNVITLALVQTALEQSKFKPFQLKLTDFTYDGTGNLHPVGVRLVSIGNPQTATNGNLN